MNGTELTPKQLAEREKISTCKVYGMLRQGCPYRRRGIHGNIIIDYDAYFNWTVEQARLSEKSLNLVRGNVRDWASKSIEAVTEA